MGQEPKEVPHEESQESDALLAEQGEEDALSCFTLAMASSDRVEERTEHGVKR